MAYFSPFLAGFSGGGMNPLASPGAGNNPMGMRGAVAPGSNQAPDLRMPGSPARGTMTSMPSVAPGQPPQQGGSNIMSQLGGMNGLKGLLGSGAAPAPVGAASGSPLGPLMGGGGQSFLPGVQSMGGAGGGSIGGMDIGGGLGAGGAPVGGWLPGGGMGGFDLGGGLSGSTGLFGAGGADLGGLGGMDFGGALGGMGGLDMLGMGAGAGGAAAGIGGGEAAAGLAGVVASNPELLMLLA